MDRDRARRLVPEPQVLRDPSHPRVGEITFLGTGIPTPGVLSPPCALIIINGLLDRGLGTYHVGGRLGGRVDAVTAPRAPTLPRPKPRRASAGTLKVSHEVPRALHSCPNQAPGSSSTRSCSPVQFIYPPGAQAGPDARPRVVRSRNARRPEVARAMPPRRRPRRDRKALLVPRRAAGTSRVRPHRAPTSSYVRSACVRLISTHGTDASSSRSLFWVVFCLMMNKQQTKQPQQRPRAGPRTDPTVAPRSQSRGKS